MNGTPYDLSPAALGIEGESAAAIVLIWAALLHLQADTGAAVGVPALVVIALLDAAALALALLGNVSLLCVAIRLTQAAHGPTTQVALYRHTLHSLPPEVDGSRKQVPGFEHLIRQINHR